MNLNEFNCYFSENYDNLHILCKKVIKNNNDCAYDILHKTYESISKRLRKGDIESTNIRGYIATAMRNWNNHKHINKKKYEHNHVEINNDVLSIGCEQDEYEASDDRLQRYYFKQEVDEYLFTKFTLKEIALFKLKILYGYTYDMIVDYTKVNRAVAHGIINNILNDIQDHFKEYKYKIKDYY